jgi:hypothetical protein
MSDLFEHLDQVVASNIYIAPIFGLPPSPVATLPDGQQVAAATFGKPDTITYWLPGSGGVYHQITQDQAFVESLYLHALYGTLIEFEQPDAALQLAGLDAPYQITPEAMRTAVFAMPAVLNLIAASNFTAAQVWAYTIHEAPNVAVGTLAYVEAEPADVVLVGVPTA